MSRRVRLIEMKLMGHDGVEEYYGVEESTWEREDTMRATYPFLFREKGT